MCIFGKLSNLETPKLGWILDLLLSKRTYSWAALLNERSNKKVVSGVIVSLDLNGDDKVQASKDTLISALKVSNEMQDTFLSALCLSKLGTLFLKTSAEKALNMLRKALSLAKKSGSIVLQIEILNDLRIIDLTVEEELKTIVGDLENAQKKARYSLVLSGMW